MTLLALIGGEWAGVPWSWRWVVILAGLAALGLWTAYRLLVRLDKYDERLPLTIEGIDYDQMYRRLVIRNDNPIAVKDVYVQVSTYKCLSRPQSDDPMPAIGYRFPWSAWSRDMPTTTADLGAGAKQVADLVFLWDKIPGKFAHAHTGPAQRNVTANFALPSGEYECRVAVGSDVTDIPIRDCVIVVSFDGVTTLQVEVRD